MRREDGRAFPRVAPSPTVSRQTWNSSTSKRTNRLHCSCSTTLSISPLFSLNSPSHIATSRANHKPQEHVRASTCANQPVHSPTIGTHVTIVKYHFWSQTSRPQLSPTTTSHLLTHLHQTPVTPKPQHSTPTKPLSHTSAYAKSTTVLFTVPNLKPNSTPIPQHFPDIALHTHQNNPPKCLPSAKPAFQRHPRSSSPLPKSPRLPPPQNSPPGCWTMTRWELRWIARLCCTRAASKPK